MASVSTEITSTAMAVGITSCTITGVKAVAGETAVLFIVCERRLSPSFDGIRPANRVTKILANSGCSIDFSLVRDVTTGFVAFLVFLTAAAGRFFDRYAFIHPLSSSPHRTTHVGAARQRGLSASAAR